MKAIGPLSKELLKLHVADSKLVYSPGKGIAALEKSVLSALRLLGHSPGTMAELMHDLKSWLVDRELVGCVKRTPLRSTGVFHTPYIPNGPATEIPPWLVDRELTLPREIDDCTLLGRCTKYTRLPDSAGTR